MSFAVTEASEPSAVTEASPVTEASVTEASAVTEAAEASERSPSVVTFTEHDAVRHEEKSLGDLQQGSPAATVGAISREILRPHCGLLG